MNHAVKLGVGTGTPARELQLPGHMVVLALDASETNRMNTYPFEDSKGQLYAIEIENAYAGIRRLAHLIGGVEGVSNVQVRKPFSRSGDVRATFRFLGEDFVIVEPFGDNSRYWIGPAKDSTVTRDLSPIEARLQGYTPPILRKLVGDLLTLNFKSLFRV